MLIQPSVLALLLVSILEGSIAVAVVPLGLRIARRWNLQSCTAEQLSLEHHTRLISALVTFMMGLQVITVPIFVFTADRLAAVVRGAMCAVGTLNSNSFGWPAVVAQIAAFFAAVAWLALDALDVRVPTYPLTRIKYVLLLGLAPVLVLAGFLEWRFFLGLRPDVITSCCSRVFSAEAGSISGHLAALPRAWALAMLVSTVGVAIVGSALVATGSRPPRRGVLAGVAGVAAFPAVIASVVAFVSPAVYNDVMHHCPFCLLKPEYGYQGYLLYVPLFIAAAGSVSLLSTESVAGVHGLESALPAMRRWWAWMAAVGYLSVAVVIGIMMARSHLPLSD
jgi:hypothetical protein